MTVIRALFFVFSDVVPVGKITSSFWLVVIQVFVGDQDTQNFLILDVSPKPLFPVFGAGLLVVSS